MNNIPFKAWMSKNADFKLRVDYLPPHQLFAV